MPFHDWPAADRRLWDDLMRGGGPLDDRGPLAHLRETSRQVLINHYGRWLGWIAAAEPEALSIAPVDRAAMERLRRWLDDLAHTRPMSRLAFVDSVLRPLIKTDPERDWTAHRSLKAALKRAAGSGDQSRKQGRILSSTVLFDHAVRYATMDATAATTKLQAFKRRRDGTMVALLALVPIRCRAVVHLELGSSIQVREDRIVISLPADLTKNRLAWSCNVPEILVPLLRLYIEEVRPWFLQRGTARHDVLWVGDRGAPYVENYFGMKMSNVTEVLTGVRVSPHLFRDAAATTLARSSPDAARLIRPVLGHTSGSTAERLR